MKKKSTNKSLTMRKYCIFWFVIFIDTEEQQMQGYRVASLLLWGDSQASIMRLWFTNYIKKKN